MTGAPTLPVVEAKDSDALSSSSSSSSSHSAHAALSLGHATIPRSKPEAEPQRFSMGDAFPASAISSGATLSSGLPAPVSTRPEVVTVGIEMMAPQHSTESLKSAQSQSRVPLQESSPRPMKQQRLSSGSATPRRGSRHIRTMKFERVGLREWEIKESRVYDMTAFLGAPPATLHFVDERLLPSEEIHTRRLVGSATGFVSLQNELQKRKALITSWSRKDAVPQLSPMIQAWKEEQPEMSLLEFWESSCGDGYFDNGADTPSQAPGEGILVYEQVLQIGIVVRGCEQLGFKEDCWRFLFPKELHTDSLMMPFGVFLASIFPQTRVISEKATDLSRVIVKYFPHNVELPVQQAPKKVDQSLYQTIGTLDEVSTDLISRLEASFTFYDFALQML